MNNSPSEATEHSAEPWRIRPGYSIESSDERIVCDLNLAHESREANARRIVACVNACKGINTETLELVSVSETIKGRDNEIGMLQSQLADLKRERWKCFHCGEMFTDAEQAKLHFGPSECSTPVCKIDAAHLRDLENQLRSYRNEDTELHRALHHMESKHAEELRREEEKGYAKGLKDYTALEQERDQLKAQNAELKAKGEWVDKWAGLIDSPHWYAPIPTGYEIDMAKTELRAITMKG